MTISVEIENPEQTQESGHIVHIFLDRDGIEQLILDLQGLSRGKQWDSIRLFSSSWGNGELSEERHLKETSTTHFLRVWLSSDDE